MAECVLMVRSYNIERLINAVPVTVSVFDTPD
jgi:hypothetical protein